MTKFDIITTKTKMLVNGTPARRSHAFVTRRIFFWRDYVIKVEWDGEYSGCRKFFHQCRSEYRLWNKLEKKDRKYFAPILEYKHTKEYDYVIQPRIKMPNTQNKIHTDIYEKFIGPIIDKYNIGDLYDDLDVNWKVLSKNKIIIFDYGV